MDKEFSYFIINKNKKVLKAFLYRDFSCFIISKNIRTAQEITPPHPILSVRIFSQTVQYMAKIGFFSTPTPPNVDFFRSKIPRQTPNFQLFVSIFAPNMYIPPKTLNFRKFIPYPLLRNPRPLQN